MKNVRTMSLFTLLGVVGIFLAGWFLLVSPKSSDAKAIKAETTSQEGANRTTKGRIDLLTKQAKDLPKKQAELAKLAQQLPSHPAQPALIRSLTTAADETGVELVGLQPAPPVAMDPVVAKPAAVDETAVTTETKTTTTPAAVRPAAARESLFAVPIEIQVRGGYFQVENFLSALEKLPRSLLVGQLTMTPDKKGPESTATGDLLATISARVFMITPNAAAVTPATAAK